MSKKKTHEEYVAELAVKNPNIEVIGKYVNANTKIMHHCLAHDVYWEIKPLNILSGQGCEFCRREKIKNSRSKTHEEYVRELKKMNPNIVVIEKYRGATISILHKCIKHNIQWRISPSDALHGNGCKICKSEKIREKLSKTNEQYVEELKTKNPNIVPIEEYIDTNTPILHECLLDKHKWKARPANLLSGHSGCPKCSKRFIRTNNDYIEDLSIKNPSIESLEDFKGMSTPILHRCKVHNVKWVAIPDNILHGHGCYECLREKIANKNSKTNNQYIDDLKKINPYITPIEEYINAYTPILHKCLIDGNEWYARPSNVLSGTGCPQCHESKGERKIRLWLDRKHIEYKTQKKFNDCCDIKPLPFDFYLPTFNIAIEYQGKQHYEPIEYFGGQEKFEIQQKHDAIKNEYCKRNGIPLLRIPYDKNIEEELNNFLFI